MNEQLSNSTESGEGTETDYLNPEDLDLLTLETILQEAKIDHLRPIEEIDTKVLPHRDRVLVGNAGHRDQIFGGEIELPTIHKKLLVVYKPESGAGHGNLEKKEFTPPRNSSPFCHKEVAAWIMAQSLGLQHLLTPTVLRNLDEGVGSIRPYVWGEPISSFNIEEFDRAYSNRGDVEDLALFDYILRYLDRKDANLILVDGDKTNRIKAIDHSLTFFHESFASCCPIKGPRLTIAYDNSTNWPTLRKTPLPDRLMKKLEIFIHNEGNTQDELKKYLSEQEIDWAFKRVHEAHERKIFL